MKILILKSSSLGDVVQALPVLRHLKAHLPHSEIYWWLEADLVPLLKGDPDLAGVIPFERRRWGSPWHWDELWAAIRQLRAMRFDWVIDLQGLARSGAIAWLANGQFLVGLDESREGAHGFYDRAARRPSFHTHAVDWYLGVLPLLQVPRQPGFDWLPARSEVAAAIRQRWPGDAERWLVLAPGARWQNKRWPVEHFAELLRRLAAEEGRWRFVVLGSHGDRPLGEALARSAPGRCLDLTGQTTLWEMVEWIRRAELMVTNDTGPMHIAAALGKPVVALFGPTEPCRTGPYGQLEYSLQLPLACVPCLKHACRLAQPLECLRAIKPEAVLAQVHRRLAVAHVGREEKNLIKAID